MKLKNMERIIWVSLTVALAGALTLPHAQNKAFKLAFVDSQKLLATRQRGRCIARKRPEGTDATATENP
jgi:hypothetical protein